VLAAAGCGGGGGGGGQNGTSSGAAKQGGVLRIGTISYIDSLNPFKYIESQATNAFIMLYPQLIQYDYTKAGGYKIVGDWAQSWDTSSDGKTWTFHLHPNTKWSDGKPLTAEDAAWTINTTVKFANGPTAVAAAALAHVKDAVAQNPTTLVIHYKTPVGNVLPQLETLSIVPKHVYEKLAKGNGNGIETFHPEQHLPLVSGGAYTLKQYQKKGTTVFVRDPNYWGPKSNADAVALTYYTNADAMISDLKQGNLDYVDQVPFSAVNVLKKDSSISVNTFPGAETTNITWNSNPKKPKNRELLDPRVKKALSMCVDRQQIINVVFAGYASTVESLVGHISPLENPNLGPLKFDCAEGNRMLDQLGYKKARTGSAWCLRRPGSTHSQRTRCSTTS
jgi:peptide/nickel transport system substrate-binding protein